MSNNEKNHKFAINQLFRTLRITNYTLTESAGNSLLLSPGMCPNLSTLETIIKRLVTIDPVMWKYEVDSTGDKPTPIRGMISPAHDNIIADTSYDKDLISAIMNTLSWVTGSVTNLGAEVVEKSYSLLCEHSGLSEQACDVLFLTLRYLRKKLVLEDGGVVVRNGFINNKLDMVKLIISAGGMGNIKDDSSVTWEALPGELPKILLLADKTKSDNSGNCFSDPIVALNNAIEESGEKATVKQMLNILVPAGDRSTKNVRMYTELEVRTLLGMARPDLNTISGKEVLDRLLASI